MKAKRRKTNERVPHKPKPSPLKNLASFLARDILDVFRRTELSILLFLVLIGVKVSQVFCEKKDLFSLKHKNSLRENYSQILAHLMSYSQIKLLTLFEQVENLFEMTIKSEFGNWAEDYVAQYLRAKGYEVIELNFRKPWGEVDIIAKKEGILIFVEVKASKYDAEGFEPENRVSPEKIRRLMRAIQTYLAAKKYSPDQDWQIDIVALTLSQDRGVAKIKHFKNIEV